MNVNAKPLSELSRLIKCLEIAGTPFKTEPQQLITTGNNDDEPLTVVIQSGLTAVHRKSDELLMGIARAPYIHGLSAWINDNYLEYSLIAQTPCTGFYLPACMRTYSRSACLARSFLLAVMAKPFTGKT